VDWSYVFFSQGGLELRIFLPFLRARHLRPYDATSRSADGSTCR
jgi:hypothetical protein